MNGIQFLDAGAVERLLDFPGCIAAMRKAMGEFTASAREQPLRSVTAMADGKLFGQMPGFLADSGLFGAKLVSVFEDPHHPGRAEHRGVVVVFSPETGEVTAVADASSVTRIRTAAASAAATDLLARPNARRLAIFGTGAQAEGHARAIATVRDLDMIEIWGRDASSAEALARRLKETAGLNARGTADPRSAAANADIICTVTASRTPILKGAWVRPGTHVNAVGSSIPGPVEIDDALLLTCRYIVDSRRSAMAAAAEFLNATAAGLIDDSHIVAEIGEVILGRVPGRTTADDITLYKSLGHVVQDLAAVEYICRRIEQTGLSAPSPSVGSVVPK